MSGSPDPREPDAGPGARSGVAVVAAFATASLLGFALIALMARWLTKEQNAEFLALWGLVMGIGAALSAVEQEIVRLATHAHLDGTRLPARALQVTGLAAAVALGVVVVLAVSPGVLGDLLRSSLLVCALVFVGTGGFAVQSLSRAVLLGTHQVGAYIAVLVGEAALRIGLAGAFLLGSVAPSLPLVALVIVVGSFGWVPVVRRVLSRLQTGTGRSSVGSIGSTVGALGLANGLQSLQVSGFTALAPAILGTSAAMAAVQGTATLARLPLVALAPIQALAVPVVTRMIRAGRHAELLGLVTKLSLAGAGVAAVAFAGGWLLGPWAVRLYLGPEYAIEPGVVATMVAASCLLAVALLEVAALIALERYRDAVATWALGAVALASTMALVGGDVGVRAAAGVTAGALVSWLVASVAVSRAARRAAGSPSPATPVSPATP